ncbi:zinc-type alcohol dehydrogenase [Fusarium beomiforme]|uniref:Zinc-type alcohol dehydrogenase n=1 Tax=Fusarium beomiforme TaxID=44412 RepID=A0A9P5AN75_9HYPO|nr:zinc-type alcohol dehydrogenase [Fusarium beomiforme]
MSSMNALAVIKFGEPARLIQRPIPTPGAGEVLLKVVAVGCKLPCLYLTSPSHANLIIVNPYDFRARDFGLFVDPNSLPMVLGNDIAGIVTALGPDNNDVDLQIGDLIFGQSNHGKRTADQSGLQEFCLLDSYATAKIPSGFTADHGASLPSNAVAAFWALFNPAALGLPPPFNADSSQNQQIEGNSIVIVGGGSNCGRYAVQFASLSGLFSTIVAVAGPRHATALHTLGATHVVDRHGDQSEVINRVRAIVGDDCMYVIDAVNHEHTLGVACLSNSRPGRMATLCPGEADLATIPEKKAGFTKVFSSGSSQNAPDLARRFWTALPGWLKSGQVKALEWDVINGLNVQAINAVWDLYRDGKAPNNQVHVHL